MPKRHDFVHRGSEHGGNMRNSKQHIPGMYTEQNQDAQAA